VCSAGSNCAGLGIVGEGTFDIFRHDTSGYYWVAFHGARGLTDSSGRRYTVGYRGIAKTVDFVTWVAGNASYGVPPGSTMTQPDAAGWRETWASGGNTGPGGGSIYEDGGYTYQLVEFSDLSLDCLWNQHWDQGLFRVSTSNLASSSAWSQYPQGNPIIYSSTAIETRWNDTGIYPCNNGYGQIFKDTTVTPNVVYMKFGRDTSDSAYNGTYLYKLNLATNLLKNGDLWTADGSYWQVIPSVSGRPNLAVYRYPNLSPDGTQLLATNCGSAASACVAGSSFYQDVNVSAYAGRSFTYGGSFASLGGNGGTSTLAIFQLDANGAAISSHALSLPLSSTVYQKFTSGAVIIAANTKTLRYQFYHGTNGVTYAADNMFLNLN
jgi:hypothetical protein